MNLTTIWWLCERMEYLGGERDKISTMNAGMVEKVLRTRCLPREGGQALQNANNQSTLGETC